jgi:DNA-binding CsgD family transcriptional regulator
LSDVPARDRLRFAIEIVDATLADRIASALKGLEDLEIVDRDDDPDVFVIAPSSAASDIALTARELEVLALLAEGASNKLIARRLRISLHTAKYHVGSLLEKLDAVSRTDAVAQAARIGVLRL